jgi:hypothetical protein
MANFFWNDQDDNHKYHLANVQSLPMGKEGRLGIPDLRDLDLCLLASWVQRYYEGNDKLWKTVVDAKYSVNSPNIFCCHERNSSPLLKRGYVGSSGC